MKKKFDTVGILLNPAAASARDILTGIFDYTRRRAHWRIRLFQRPEELTADTIASLLDNGLTGFIDALPEDKDTERRLAALPVKTVVIMLRDFDYRLRTKNTSFIANEDVELGRRAAQYFLRLGNFNTYGFVQPQGGNASWSQEREDGYCDELAKANKKPRIFENLGLNPLTDRQLLSDWLKELPKPAALLAPFDYRAGTILEICEQDGLRVPEDISVIGVDNDEMVCSFSNPPLTSFQPNHVLMGQTAAAELHRLLRARKPTPVRTIRIGGNKLVERESTRPPTYGQNLVERARAFIARNAHVALTPTDVVEHLGVSRRLADLRFHEYAGETIAEAILRTRLENIRRELETTNRQIAQIARNNDFTSLSHLANLFKAKYGMTMSDWRNQATRAPQSGKSAS